MPDSTVSPDDLSLFFSLGSLFFLVFSSFRSREAADVGTKRSERRGKKGNEAGKGEEKKSRRKLTKKKASKKKRRSGEKRPRADSSPSPSARRGRGGVCERARRMEKKLGMTATIITIKGRWRRKKRNGDTGHGNRRAPGSPEPTKIRAIETRGRDCFFRRLFPRSLFSQMGSFMAREGSEK